MTGALIAPAIPRFAKLVRLQRVLVGAGCVLLLISLIVGVVQRPRQTSFVPTATPGIEVRAQFAGLAPGGQTSGFAVAPDGSLAVVDRIRQMLIRLDPTGLPVAEWGPRFEAEADAQDLGGIAAAGTDWYLLDRGRARILRLDATGRATNVMDLQSLGTYGPNGLAVDSSGQVYLADTGGNRILIFSPAGAPVGKVGTAGAGLGQLKQPISLSFGPDGAMYVSDSENSRIERWSADLQATNSWNLAVHAWGIAVDRAGRVFVTNADKKTVTMYAPHGEVLAEIGPEHGENLGVNFPTQVGVSPDGSWLWVMGNDGLARVDLTPFSEALPGREEPGGMAFPVAAAGAALLALGVAPFTRRIRFGSARPAAVTRVSDISHPAEHLAPPTTHTFLTRAARLRLAVGMALFWVGLFGVVLSELYLSGPTGRNNPWMALSAQVMSGIVWAAGCAIGARALPFSWVGEWPGRLRTSALPILTTRRLIAIGAGVALAVVAAALWWFGRFETIQATFAAVIWLIALALVASVCIRFKWSPPSLLTLAPLLMFAVALVPRVWQIADLPFGVWYDEAQGALEIRRVVQQGTYTPILNTYGKDTSGFFYLIPALSVVLTDNVAAARAAAALVGSLTVPLTYLLGRELFGWRVGLAAGALLAFSRWHLNFSRLGFNPISLPLCDVLAFWLLARAIRTRQWSDMALAGLALGLGMHAYTGFRGTTVVALFALGFAAVAQRWSIRSLVSRAGVYLGGFALSALPVLIFAIQDPVRYNGRTAQTLILAQPVSTDEKLRQIWETLQRHILMFNVSGDLNGRHNLPGAPMLDPLSVVLVVLGLGWVIVRWRDWRTATLLAWGAVSLSGGILTLAFEAPQAVRTVGVTPVLALLGGVGLIATADRIVAIATIPRSVPVRAATAIAAGFAMLSLVWIGFTNLDTFFNRQMRNADVFSAFSTRETIPVRAALQSQGNIETILSSTTMFPSVQAAYMTPALQARMRPIDSVGDLPYRGQGPGLVFLETEHDQALADAVARMYPDVAPQLYVAPDGGKPIVEGFRLNADTLAQTRGLLANYRGADGSTLERHETRTEVDPGAIPVTLPADVSWRSVLVLDTTGEYSFRASAGLHLRIDDALVAEAGDSGVRVQLARGNHALELAGNTDGTDGPRLEWRPPDTADWQPIPTQFLFAGPPGGTGLQLTLVSGTDSSAAPSEIAVDPVLSHYYHVSPFARVHQEPQQWIGEWNGQLEVTAAGSYGFSLDHSQTAGVSIDGQQMLGNLNASADTPKAVVQLTEGLHTIRVRYEKTTEGSPWINLYWTPPGAQSTVVPTSVLYPPPPEVLGPAPQG